MANLKTVTQIITDTPGLTHGGVRWDLFNADKNGLADTGAIIRRGRRILIDEDLYLRWMRDRSGHVVAKAG